MTREEWALLVVSDWLISYRATTEDSLDVLREAAAIAERHAKYAAANADSPMTREEVSRRALGSVSKLVLSLNPAETIAVLHAALRLAEEHAARAAADQDTAP